MKSLFLTLVTLLVVFNLNLVNAQVEEKTEVYEKEHVKNKKPVPYVPVREADVTWTKTIWRMVDLRQKMNQPLYFPIKPIGNRMSLISLLLYGINNEGLQVYDPYAPDNSNEFQAVMTKEAVDFNMGNVPDTVPIMDSTGNYTNQIIPASPKIDQIQQLLVKELWYFDKQHSVMNVRVIGICPIRLFTKPGSPEIVKKLTFWVYYPEVRALFANHEIFNRNNDAQRISYDDFILQRRFEGYIHAESNVYDDRAIIEYTTGLATLYESERVEGELFRIEHDLWEY